MSFYLKYELSRLLHSDGAKTFQAIEKSSRQDVLLHLVDKAASPELVDKLKHLESGRDPELVEVGEFAGSYYVVTRPIDEFQGLATWLELRVSDVLTRPAPPPADAAPEPTARDSTTAAVDPAPSPGEFTEVFGSGAAPTPSQTPAPEPVPPTSPTMLDPLPDQSPEIAPAAQTRPTPPAAPAPEPAPAPGEFTKLFGESEKPAQPPAPAPAKVSAPEPPPQPPAEPAPPSAPPSTGPGEFTQLFGGAPETTTRTPPPPLGAQAEEPAGILGDSGQSNQPSIAPATPSPQPTPTTQSGTPVEKSSGEFTRLFGDAPSKSVPRLEPKTPTKAGIEKSSGEFTQLFGPDGKGSSAPATPKPPPAPYAPQDKPLGGSAGAPGEFTRMFGGDSSAPSPPTGIGGQAPPPGPASFGEGLVGEVSGDEALDPSQGQRVSKSSKPFQAPGEFTRMFGPSDPSQQQAQDFVPAAQGGKEGYASGLFKNPHAESRPPQPDAGMAPPPPLAGGAGQATEPGEYTRMIEGRGGEVSPPAQAAAAMPASAPVEPAAKSGPSKGMLIALVIAVIVAGLSLGAAVYLFLNRGSSEPAPEAPAGIEQPAEPASNGN